MILTLIAIILSIILYKTRYIFNRDLLRDYSDDPNVPHLKNGFGLAFLSSGIGNGFNFIKMM